VDQCAAGNELAPTGLRFNDGDQVTTRGGAAGGVACRASFCQPKIKSPNSPKFISWPIDGTGKRLDTMSQEFNGTRRQKLLGRI